MLRRLTPILCLVALLMQVVTGGFPAGEFCIGRCDEEPAADSCCGNHPEGAGDGQARCVCLMGDAPGTHGCERCALIQVPHRETVVAQRIAPTPDQAALACVVPTVARIPSLAEAMMRRTLRSRANESPPHLRSLNITRLIV